MPRTPQINRLVNLRKRLESEYNNKLYVDTLKIKKTKNRLTHVDLFSGAGGNIEGMRQAGFDTLLSIEIDPDASNTIKKNFPTVNHIEGNICDVQGLCQNRLRDATYFTIRSIFIFAFT